MIWCSIFDVQTGEIIQHCTVKHIDAAPLEAGQKAIAGRYDFDDTLIAWDATTETATPYARPQSDLDARRLDQAKRAGRQQASSAFRRFEAALTAGVPEGERLSWGTKEAAARRWQASEATTEDLALLDAERAVTGETRQELTDQIIGRADQYRGAVGLLAGVRRTVLAGIDAATTVAEVDAALAGLAALDP